MGLRRRAGTSARARARRASEAAMTRGMLGLTVSAMVYPMGCTRVSPSGHDGGEDGPPPSCSGDPSEKNVTEACGVFVSASAPAGGAGTRTSPYDTLQKAIDNAGGKRVYACATMPFSEAVTISAGIELFGGFADCTTDKGWTWTQAGRSELDGPADQVALTIAAGAD